MGKIVISENVSLDGIAAGERLVEWVGQIKGEAAKVLFDEALSAGALLLGRRTYEFFAARWPSRGGEYADRLNTMPKYVVSSTLRDPAWNNTTVLAGDLINEVRKLTEELSRDIVVYGSIQLAHGLIEHDLADELRLMVYPVALGAGQPLFEGGTDSKPLRLLSCRTVGDVLASLTYQFAGGGARALARGRRASGGRRPPR